MRMFVNDRIMPMSVGVRFGHYACMTVLMMFVVHMHVVVFQRLMSMDVVVSFAHQQADSGYHREHSQHFGSRRH
jgi:hypothetical protein